jgi:4-alpha-glucanotransferase
MISLHWAIHNHQPVGNFDFIFERAFAQAYQPFAEVLAAHPKIRMSMHFSGILLDWLEAKRPQYLASLRTLVEKGQLEILGGGFYEPILPVISDAHKIGQLRKLSKAVERLFGTSPRGIWLAERVWEPTLVKPISEAGLEFVLLDGSHFKMVGKTDADMDGYFLSEDQGHTLKLFPIHDVVRDYIPFRPVDEVVDTLLRLDDEGRAKGVHDVQVVFGDDGEKFGDWPFTHDTVYKDRWLHRFFERVETMPDRIRVSRMADGLNPGKNLGLVYLPPASYQEMMVWAQDARDIPKFRETQRHVIERDGMDAAKFLRGTFWRNFFNKYAESNQIHKQAIRLAQAWERHESQLDGGAREKALDHIWQAQCNCAYWHGVFGGLYLPHLRFALYRNLIAAQATLDAAMLKGKDGPVHEAHDWNCDGKPEHTLNSPEVYLSLSANGEIDQFWLKKTGINLVDTLTRRYEAYHDQVGGKAEAGTKLENSLGEKEEGLRGYLIYDRKLRRSLSDVYLRPDTGFEAYASQQYQPAFEFTAREAALERRKDGTGIRFLGLAKSPDGTVIPAEKAVFLAKGSPNLRVEWKFSNPVTNAGKPPVEFRFGSEALFCLLAGNAHDRYVAWGKERAILASRGDMGPVEKVAVADEWLGLRCEARFPGIARTWRDALETVSQSEGGYERVYQGTVLLPIWDIKMAAGGEASASLSIQFREGA